jgi:hypothetical protein
MVIGSRGWPVRETDDLTAMLADCLQYVGSSTSRNMIGLHRLLQI